MKQLLIIVSVFIFAGWGCTPSPDVSPSPESVSRPAPAQPVKLEHSLIGAWHGADVVGSGFSERYVFFEDGTFLFMQSEYEYPAGQEPKAPALVGDWSLDNATLTIVSKRAVSFDDDNQPLVQPLVSQQELAVGAFEDVGKSGPYSIKSSFGQQPFWKWSDDPLYACQAYPKELAYEACDLLINAYADTK